MSNEDEKENNNNYNLICVLTCRMVRDHLLWGDPKNAEIAKLCTEAHHDELSTRYKQYCRDQRVDAFVKYLNELENLIMNQSTPGP